MIYSAILGFGTVGSGVAQVLTERREAILASTGKDIGIKYILDLRDFPGSPFESLMTKDFSVIENDPEISIVVEAMGGVGAAYQFTKRALLSGKSVVTSNKELVATHGKELLSIAKDKGGCYLFEASVGGGIPVLHPIVQCMGANRIDEVYGIVNGTTNYILTQMFENGQSFDDALADAQALGYAERDPSADVDGFDACRKICILTALCFGRHINPADVATTGIRAISSDDIALAAKAGYAIKLLARSRMTDDGSILACVAPHLVPLTAVISGVRGVINAVVVRGNNVGDVLFSGAGAGKLPTASAVVSDVIEILRDPSPAGKPFGCMDNDAVLADPDSIPGRHYLRVKGSVKAQGKGYDCVSCGDYSAVITAPVTRSDAEALAEKLGAEAVYAVLE